MLNFTLTNAIVFFLLQEIMNRLQLFLRLHEHWEKSLLSLKTELLLKLPGTWATTYQPPLFKWVWVQLEDYSVHKLGVNEG